MRTSLLLSDKHRKLTYLDDAVSFSDAPILGRDAVRVDLKHISRHLSTEWVTETRTKINNSPFQSLRLTHNCAHPSVFVLHRNKQDLGSCRGRRTGTDLFPSLFQAVFLDPCTAAPLHSSVHRPWWPEGIKRHSWLLFQCTGMKIKNVL